jgi:adenine-specific DNA methylase
LTTDKRLIEESFPVKEVSAESAREKSIRHGHISTLHIWWARRPLAASRATAYAALVPPPNDDEEWQKQRNFIIELSKWENSNNPALLEKARADILKANGGIPPKVLDPFGGGGSIPLEALRLGCETYSNDYNPVAVLIQKCTLEYPQKYGHRPKKNEKWGELSGSEDNPLLADVKKWGKWVLEEAREEIGMFYPSESDGSIPVGFIWARTIPCQNPSCGAEIPLMRQYWLAKRNKKMVLLFPYIDKGKVKFKIVGDGYEKIPNDFDPGQGTVSRAVANCPCCGSTVDANTTHKLFQEGKSGQRMVSVVLHKSGTSGKKYRISSEQDLGVFREADIYLEKKNATLRKEWGIEPVPDEPLMYDPRNIWITPYFPKNQQILGSLFNSRQKLAHIVFSEKVHKASEKMLKEGYDVEYAKAITSYLAIGVNRMADYNSSLCLWHSSKELVAHTFGRQALAMIWDFIEGNPFSNSTGNWNDSFDYLLRFVNHASHINNTRIFISHSSSTNLGIQDNFFDAVLTDPPYYDNVGYANLSDFFYVWFKRTVGGLYPDLFSTPLTPKTNEIVSDAYRQGGKEQSKEFFESMLKKAFQEIHRVLKPNGIAVIVYAHKSTEGWETLINSLLDSGLIMTGAWPLNTEMGARLNARETAALASSIYIVARKMERQPTGFYNNVKEELKTHLNKKLERLWNEGISGADFFIAAIGSAIEVFGKYEQVMDYEGNIVRADRLLVDVRKIATDYAVRQILHNGFAGEISDFARLYVLWRWNYSEAKVPFDEGRKLGQSCGIDISHEWSHTGFVKKEKEFIRLLGPQERKLEDLEGSKDMIDVLHQVLLLWEKSRRDEMIKVLQVTGYGKSEAFYRVAQAISESLPMESKEKKLLDGFLAGRERMSEEVKKEAKQARLDV